MSTLCKYESISAEVKPVHSCEEVLTPTWSNKDVIERVLLYDGVICKERTLGMQPHRALPSAANGA